VDSTYPADFFPSQSELAEDLVEPLSALRDAGDGAMKIACASTPGLGVVPDDRLLKEFALQVAEI
jgi:hypothetical protein